MDPRIDFANMAFCGIAGLCGGTISALVSKEQTAKDFGICMFGGLSFGGFGASAVCVYHNVDPGLAGGIALSLGVGVRIVIAGVQKVLETIITATVNRNKG